MKRNIITQDMLAEFENFLRNDEKSSNTVQKYLRDIRAFAGFAGQEIIDRQTVLAYKAWLEKNYAVAGANSMLAALNSFFKFAGRIDLCVKPFRQQRRVYSSRELTKGEYFALVRAAENRHNQRLSLLIQTICGAGIRISEIEFITVEALRRGEATVSCKGKTRRVFLVCRLCKKLLQYARQQKIVSGAVFITKYGKLMNRSNIWREMKALCQTAGVDPQKVFPHNLRHLFARTFYAIEKDIAKLADILGHESINTTRIYIISSGAEHRKKLENMHLIL